jgi:hypothetical protein
MEHSQGERLTKSAQAGRASDVQLPTESQSRSCLQPNG